MANIKLGITLFCFGTEYASGEYSFEDCVREAAKMGSKGYEIVATQMIPSYPYVSDEFLGMVNACKAKYGIGPVTYGANQDRGMRVDRDLTDDEMLAMAIIDLKSANKLGCKYMRVQYMMSPEAFERLAPYAEIFDVKCGIEIHNPETPTSPKMLKYLEVIKRTGSKYIGFVPDFGCFATAPNYPKWKKALEDGVPEKFLNLARDMKYDDVPIEEASKRLIEAGAPMQIMGMLQGMYGFVQFRREADLEGLKSIIPYSFEFHAKFHYLDENNHEPAIPYEEILPVIAASDFDGYIMAEYEDELNVGGKVFTHRLIELEKKILNID